MFAVCRVKLIYKLESFHLPRSVPFFSYVGNATSGMWYAIPGMRHLGMRHTHYGPSKTIVRVIPEHQGTHFSGQARRWLCRDPNITGERLAPSYVEESVGQDRHCCRYVSRLYYAGRDDKPPKNLIMEAKCRLYSVDFIFFVHVKSYGSRGAHPWEPMGAHWVPDPTMYFFDVALFSTMASTSVPSFCCHLRPHACPQGHHLLLPPVNQRWH